MGFIFNQKLYLNSIHIINDGTKFLAVYERDYDNYLKENPNTEIWETHSKWSESIDKTIKNYNEFYYDI